MCLFLRDEIIIGFFTAALNTDVYSILSKSAERLHYRTLLKN